VSVPVAHSASSGVVPGRPEDDLLNVQSPLALAGGGAASSLDIPFAGAGGFARNKASFMGLEAYGRRFCIIADRSSSMAGAPLAFVKNELITTLGGMRAGSRFYVIFYDTMAEPCPANRWLTGRVDARNLADWVARVDARGGTDPLPAFQLAFAMNPLPDTIFFMTDGIFNPGAADVIAAMNTGRKKVPIYTISFINPGAAFLLQRIAAESGGGYRHVAGP
jgi:Ca-activated chloride channel family protein